jgi:hypothetical protein
MLRKVICLQYNNVYFATKYLNPPAPVGTPKKILSEIGNGQKTLGSQIFVFQ